MNKAYYLHELAQLNLDLGLYTEMIKSMKKETLENLSSHETFFFKEEVDKIQQLVKTLDTYLTITSLHISESNYKHELEKINAKTS